MTQIVRVVAEMIRKTREFYCFSGNDKHDTCLANEYLKDLGDNRINETELYIWMIDKMSKE